MPKGRSSILHHFSCFFFISPWQCRPIELHYHMHGKVWRCAFLWSQSYNMSNYTYTKISLKILTFSSTCRLKVYQKTSDSDTKVEREAANKTQTKYRFNSKKRREYETQQHYANTTWNSICKQNLPGAVEWLPFLDNLRRNAGQAGHVLFTHLEDVFFCCSRTKYHRPYRAKGQLLNGELLHRCVSSPTTRH